MSVLSRGVRDGGKVATLLSRRRHRREMCQTAVATTATTTSNSSQLLFTHKEVSKDVFLIDELFFDSWNKANIYYVVGSRRDLLIDTGTGIHNLARYLTASGLWTEGKPLSVVLTHAHFDHSGGLQDFADDAAAVEELCIHGAEVESIGRGDRVKTAAWVTPGEVTVLPYEGWDAKEYRVRPVSNARGISDGDQFDLGNRVFDTVHLPGHTSGSIALVDRKHGILATGDTVYATDGELIDWYPGGSSVSAMCSSVKTIAGIVDNDKWFVALPGHNEVLYGSSEISSACARHLSAASSWARAARKAMLSRPRAALIIAANAAGIPLPGVCREWIKT